MLEEGTGESISGGMNTVPETDANESEAAGQTKRDGLLEESTEELISGGMNAVPETDANENEAAGQTISATDDQTTGLTLLLEIDQLVTSRERYTELSEELSHHLWTMNGEH